MGNGDGQMDMPDEHDRLVAIGHHLQSIVEAAKRLRRRQGDRVMSVDSQAHNEVQNWAASDNETTPLTEAHFQGLKALLAAEDFCSASVDMAGRPDRSFSTMTVLRGAAEASAKAFWYLDPSIGADERAARAIGGLQVAVGSAKRFGRKARIEFGEDVSAEIDALDAVIRKHPGGATTPPNWEQLLRGIGRTMQLEDRVSDAGLESLSNAAHSMKDARDQIIIGWEEDGSPILQTHRASEWGYWYVANIFAAAVSHAAELLGWDDEQWLREATASTEELQKLFNTVKAERTRR